MVELAKGVRRESAAAAALYAAYAPVVGVEPAATWWLAAQDRFIHDTLYGDLSAAEYRFLYGDPSAPAPYVGGILSVGYNEAAAATGIDRERRHEAVYVDRRSTRNEESWRHPRKRKGQGRYGR